MGAPEKIKLNDNGEVMSENEEFNQQEIITAVVKGEKVMMTVQEAVSLINQVSGVLLAYEYSRSS